MSSLKDIYKDHGTNVIIDNENSFEYGSNPFKITKENNNTFSVEYLNGMSVEILKECEDSNDYFVREIL